VCGSYQRTFLLCLDRGRSLSEKVSKLSPNLPAFFFHGPYVEQLLPNMQLA